MGRDILAILMASRHATIGRSRPSAPAADGNALRFLAAAERAAGGRNLFRWRDVGASLGLGEMESYMIAAALAKAAAICLPADSLGQMLPAGRQMLQETHKPAPPPRRDAPERKSHPKHKPDRHRAHGKTAKGHPKHRPRPNAKGRGRR